MAFSIEHLKSIGRDLAMGAQALSSSKEFLDLVKAIGESKSKAEEDRIMTGEVEQLKKRLAEPDVSKKKMKEYLIRLVYVEMLGHDASFGYIHAVKMTHDENLHLKRTGYLATTLFLDDDHDLIILIVNTIQKDLKSDNHLIVCTALSAVCKLINEETIPAVLPQIVDLLTHPKELVRKKAVMVLHRFHQRSPSSVAHLIPKFRQALCDKDPSVMSASLCALNDLVAAEPSAYRNLIPSFVSILKQVAESRLPAAFNYHKTPAPFIQIKLLKILAMLGAQDKAASEQMYGVLTDVLRRGDSKLIIGNAILYECICTISSIHPNNKLLVSCAEITSRFLKSDSHNLKYMGIDALGRIVKINPDFANEHQIAVIDCLEDPDDTLKRKTLDLLYKMTKPGNVEVIVERMIGHMRSLQPHDSHRKAELSGKIIELAERFAPTNQWFIQTMNSVFELAGDVVQPKVAHDLMRLIAEGSGEEDASADQQLRSSAMDAYMRLLKEPDLPAILLQTICWVLGEYGTADGRRSTDDVIGSICDVAESHAADDVVRGYALSAIAKLVSFEISKGRPARLIPEAQSFLDAMLAAHSTDLQQRAYELQALMALPPATVAAVMPFDASCEDVEVDRNLPFLNSFVEDALMKGAKPYLSESDRLREGGLSIVSSTHEDRPSVSEKALRFEAYEKPQAPVAGRTALSTASSSDFLSSRVPFSKIEVGTAEQIHPNDVFLGRSSDSAPSSSMARLKLDGVQRKWGRPPPAAAAPVDSEVTPSASSFGPSAKASLAVDDGPTSKQIAAKYRSSAAPEVSDEKRKLAAVLFGGGAMSGKEDAPALSSRNRESTGARRHSSHGSNGSAPQHAEPAPQVVAKLNDLPDLLLDLSSNAPPIPSTSAEAITSDPFVELESLFVPPSANIADANAVGDGDVKVDVGANSKSSSEVKKSRALERDAIARKAGVVTQTTGANAELFKDILS